SSPSARPDCRDPRPHWTKPLFVVENHSHLQQLAFPMIPSPVRGGLLAALFCLSTSALAAAPSPQAVASHYADMAVAKYQDALTGARQLGAAVDALAASPSNATLTAARTAWVAARVPYMQT